MHRFVAPAGRDEAAQVRAVLVQLVDDVADFLQTVRRLTLRRIHDVARAELVHMPTCDETGTNRVERTQKAQARCRIEETPADHILVGPNVKQWLVNEQDDGPVAD